VILDDYYLEAVRQDFALNDLVELRSLASRLHWSEHQRNEHKSGAVTQDTFSF
jgi:hypothetical protein